MCCSEWRNEILHPTGTWDMVASLFSISALSASHSVAIRVSQHLTGTSSNDGGDGCVCLSMLSLFHSQCPPGSSRLLHLTDAPALLGLRSVLLHLVFLHPSVGGHRQLSILAAGWTQSQAWHGSACAIGTLICFPLDMCLEIGSLDHLEL
jgi:hypothetical protein